MDKSIIQQAVQGNAKSFKKIFEVFLPKMRPVALRYAHTQFEADDILQESFVKIFHHLKDFKHDGNFEGWVRRIVVNTALNNYKKNKRFNTYEQLDNLMDSCPESDSTEGIDDLEPSQVLKLINELPEGYKVVFNLYVFDELSHKEIAEILQISDGTSRSQYSKAKKMLKILMSRQQSSQKSSLYKEDNQNGK